MYKRTSELGLGFIEFDDRGNSRWLPHEEAHTEDTLLRLLDVSELHLVPDEVKDLGVENFYKAIERGRR